MAVAAPLHVPVSPPPLPPIQPIQPAKLSLRNFFVRLNEDEGRPLRVRLLNVRVLFNITGIVYGATKIFIWDTLLIRSVYKIIKLLKKIFAFTEVNYAVKIRDFFRDSRVSHTILKLAYNAFNAISGAFDLITRNEITKLAYEAFGLGYDFVPFSPAIMRAMETMLIPLTPLKFTAKATHLYVVLRKVLHLKQNTPSDTRWANLILLAKASLEFGIETLRCCLHILGLGTGSYAAIFTLASLGIISNSLGLVKHLFPIREIADAELIVVPNLALPPKS